MDKHLLPEILFTKYTRRYAKTINVKTIKTYQQKSALMLC